MQHSIGTHTVLIFDVDGLSWLDGHLIMVAGTLFLSDAGAVIIEVETLRAGTAIHRQEVRSATLLH